MSKEYFRTLRTLYRESEYRRFRCKHRSNRYAEILGFAPDGSVIGFWEGQDDVTRFPADEQEWNSLTVYV